MNWLQRATWKDFMFDGSFVEAVGSIFAMAQCFGVMPVVGIKSKSASKLKFEWHALRTIYSLILFAFVLIYTIFTVWMAFGDKLKFDSVGMLWSKIFFSFICVFKCKTLFSSSNILWFSCLRNVLFWCVGNKMASTHATLGISGNKIVKIPFTKPKTSIGLSS